MSQDRIKIVVWDSIGNTLLGVRPWASWTDSQRTQFLAENPAGESAAPSFDQLFAGRNVDLIWFNSPEGPHQTFGALHEDFRGSVRFVQSIDEVAAEVQDADYLVLHKERLPEEALRGATRLKLVQHLGLDHRGMPTAVAHDMGVPAAATPLINYITVAEHVWAFILNWSKRLPALRELMRSRDYNHTWGVYPNLQYLGDVTLGLLGMGEIARPVARVAQAFDMPIIYWDIQRFPELEEKYGMKYVEWDEIFARSDVLSVQLALNAQTHGIIGEREIGLMKPTSLFINTARGKLVDQAALTKGVADFKIGAVAIDAYAFEPLPTDDPLLDLHDLPGDRITLTPHCAWQSPWTWVRDSQEIWYNVLRSMNGEPIHHLV